MKLKFEMTPIRRNAVAYWVGTLQAILSMTFLQELDSADPMGLQWIIYLAGWILIGFVYVRNSEAFRKETLWMTIKNPAKITVSAEDHAKRQRPIAPPPQGSRPPPPPAPPNKRTFNLGHQWPPKGH